jgi:hypothetical protein
MRLCASERSNTQHKIATRGHSMTAPEDPEDGARGRRRCGHEPREMEAILQQRDAEEREQNERWPNLGHVRAKIKKRRDSGKAQDWAKSFDANNKLDQLLSTDEH